MVIASKSGLNQGIRRPHEISSPKGKRLFTLKEGAEYLGRSEWGMRGLIWAGEIPIVRSGGRRKIFLDVEDLDEFIKRNKSTYL